MPNATTKVRRRRKRRTRLEISLSRISNRNEKRVIRLLPEVLEDFPRFEPDDLDIQDIYALTLNKLRPRYSQRCSIVLREPITDEIIIKKMRQAVRRVKRFPNHP